MGVGNWRGGGGSVGGDWKDKFYSLYPAFNFFPEKHILI